jgi:cytochrome c peroxidase
MIPRELASLGDESAPDGALRDALARDFGSVDHWRAEDFYVFRVPGLRNVAKTPPYFPDGGVATLPEAVKVMARVQRGVTVDEAETHDIVAFLESLAGELPANFATIATRPSGSVIEAQ